jgi:DnaD/phage-associated family protein
MAYRLVYSNFWLDPTIQEEMTQDDRYFYLYLLTNPHTTHCGIYTVTKRQMGCELGYTEDIVNCLLVRFESNFKLIKYNPETRELAIKNWGKYNLSRGGKPVLDCLTSELARVKDVTLIAYVHSKIKNETISELYKSFYTDSTIRGKALPREGDNTYTNTNTSTNTFTYTNTDTVTINDTASINNTVTDTGFAANTPEITVMQVDENTALSIMQDYEKLTGRIGILNMTSLKIALVDHGERNVRRAIDKALEKDKFTMPYINGILRGWARDGYPKEGENYGDCSSVKDNAADKTRYSSFRPKKPKALDTEEYRDVERELL